MSSWGWWGKEKTWGFPAIEKSNWIREIDDWKLLLTAHSDDWPEND